jgi:microcystin-dependent protein
MANPFVGEIRMFAGNFPPSGWAFCDGSLLPISENDTLFALIGTIYGGDGQNTFALPDLRGRVPVHQGQGPGLSPRVIGQLAGTENVTLIPTQLPAHNHVLNATTTAAVAGTGVAGSLTGTVATGTQIYGSTPGGAPLAASALTSSGGNQPHNNMAPFLSVNFIISLFGIFPSQG